MTFILDVDRPGLELRVAQLASAQFGVVSRRQLISAGLGAAAIDYRVRTGRLRVIHGGVYAIAYERREWMTRAMAALLACGPDAVLSHGSAAAIFEIRPYPLGPIEISSPSKHRMRGISHHRTHLSPQITTSHRGLRVTTVERTLLDLAGVLDDRALMRAFNEARGRHGTRAAEIERLLASAGRGHCGAARLRRLVVGGQAPTRSAFEDEFLTFIVRHKLPQPEVNRRIAGHEVDMVWPDSKLVVELDGWRYHDSRDRFERDRMRDADLLAAGYRVMRITWRRLTQEPAREARRLRSLLLPPSSP